MIKNRGLGTIEKDLSGDLNALDQRFDISFDRSLEILLEPARYQ